MSTIPSVIAANANINPDMILAAQVIAAIPPMYRGKTIPQVIEVAQFNRNMRQRRYRISSYQRDMFQRSRAWQSLFMDSVMNWLPTGLFLGHVESDPATLAVSTHIDDGQQRGITIETFMADEWALSPHADVDYSEMVTPHAGKRFSELPRYLQDRIRDYTVVFVVFPEGTPEGVLLEAFWRFNQGQLSAQDIRQAMYWRSSRGQMVRAAGLREPEDRNGCRVLGVAAKFGVSYPWKDAPAKMWREFWGDSTRAMGQTAPEDILWYMIIRWMAPHGEVDNVQTGPNLAATSLVEAAHLKARVSEATATLANRFMEQLQAEELHPDVPQLVPSMGVFQKWFAELSVWFVAVLEKATQLGKRKFYTNASSRLLRTLAVLAATFKSPKALSDDQWKLVFWLLKGSAQEVNFHLRPKGWTKDKFKFKNLKGKIRDFLQHVDALFNAMRNIVALDPTTKKSDAVIAADFKFKAADRPRNLAPIAFTEAPVPATDEEDDSIDSEEPDSNPVVPVVPVVQPDVEINVEADEEQIRTFVFAHIEAHPGVTAEGVLKALTTAMKGEITDRVRDLVYAAFGDSRVVLADGKFTLAAAVPDRVTELDASEDGAPEDGAPPDSGPAADAQAPAPQTSTRQVRRGKTKAK